MIAADAHATPSPLTRWILLSAFAVLAWRLGRFVHAHAVNILYWDQWDFLAGLFGGADAWTLFRWQHGPQRQGVGNLVIAALFGVTGWNSKADVAASAVAMALAAGAALYLVKRLCGALRPWDVIVPLLFLTTTNAQTYAVPNISHGPLPALFLVTFALASTIARPTMRCGALVAVNALAVNTGFTLLLGGLTPALLALMASAPGLQRRERMAYAAGAVVSLALLGVFFIGFQHTPAVACFQFPDAEPWRYVPFTGFVLGHALGLDVSADGRRAAIASAIAIAAAAGASYAGWRVVRARAQDPLWVTVLTLGGFAVAFAAVTAVGRACLGIDAAGSSRYIPYILPAVLAIHVALRRGMAGTWGSPVLLGALLVLSLQKERDPASANEALAHATSKREWRTCYRSRHDIEACDARAGHGIYPSPETTRLQQKLDWLETRGLNLFREPIAGSPRP